MDEKKVNVAIIGAGVGGLATAIALARQQPDLNIQVYEKYSTFDPNAGIELSLGASGQLALKALGVNLDMVLERFGVPILLVNMLKSDGELINTLPARKILDIVPRSIGRSDFLRGLLDSLIKTTSNPDIVKWGHKLTSIKQSNDSVTAHFSNGETVTADFLIGADGIRSTVRQCVFDKVEPTYSGANLIYGVITDRKFLEPKEKNIFRIILDKKFTLVSCCVNNVDPSVWWALCYPSEKPIVKPTAAISEDETIILWENEGNINIRHFVNDQMKEAGSLPKQYISATTPGNFRYAGGLFRRDLLEKMDWHVGRVVLVGDAMHAMLPWSGSGASMAIEDGYVLSKELCSSMDDFSKAFNNYRDNRYPRVNKFIGFTDKVAPQGLGANYMLTLTDDDLLQFNKNAIIESPAYPEFLVRLKETRKSTSDSNLLAREGLFNTVEARESRLDKEVKDKRQVELLSDAPPL